MAIALIAGVGCISDAVGFRRPVHSGGRVMLAVLPFENLTGDAGQEYFSDGMTRR